MTPVATPVAITATSWDAALAETLSQAARRASADGARPCRVHSVHARVLNIRHDDALIALADDLLDDAPCTVRVPLSDGLLEGIRVGDGVRLRDERIEITTATGIIVIALAGAPRWVPPAITAPLTADALATARATLDALPSPIPATPFGRASAALLDTGAARLRTAALARLHGGREQDAEVTDAANGLLGLGEGLTPSGDDILTGLALIAAHETFALTDLIPALAASLLGAAERTTLLSAVTLQAAIRGRGRERLHDLITAIAAGDRDRLAHAVTRTTEIGHTSGHDILTGIRLALELSARTHPNRLIFEGDHR